MDFIRNEKGVTLIEVLVSIVILSIIFMSIMRFFPQVGMMNKQNIEKTQGINNAKQVLNQWQTNTAVKDIFNGSTSIPEYNYQNDPTNIYYIFNSKDGSVNVKINRSPDNPDTVNVKNPIKAYRIYIKILNGRTTSETYGYLYN